MSNTPYVTTDALKTSLGTEGATIGFYGATGASLPTITGSYGTTGGVGAILTDLVAALGSQGLIKDSTTA